MRIIEFFKVDVLKLVVTTQAVYNIDIHIFRKKCLTTLSPAGFTQRTQSFFTQSSQRINNKSFAVFAAFFALPARPCLP
jgi:hypothetical protein